MIITETLTSFKNIADVCPKHISGQLEATCFEGFDHRVVGELKAVVNKVKVGRAHVVEVWLQDQEATAGAKNVEGLSNDKVYLVFVVEVLEDVGAKNNVKGVVVEVVVEARDIAVVGFNATFFQGSGV